MRTKKTHISSSRRIRRKLLGNKIKSEKLSIPDSSVSFFEDMPLYRKKKDRRSTRRLGKKHTYSTRKTSK